MAFKYFTIDAIRNIDADNISDDFISYYQGLPDEMRTEIREIRPDLVQAMEKNQGNDADLIGEDVADIPEEPAIIDEETSEDAVAAEPEYNEPEAGTESDDLSADDIDVIDSESDEMAADDPESDDLEYDGYSAVLDLWEDISIRAWQNDSVDTTAVVCKIVPKGTRKCGIHRIPLRKKRLKIHRESGGTYNMIGYLCPECMDFYVEDDDIPALVEKLGEYHIPTWIQPVADTLAEWRENAEPVEIGDDTIIYVPDTWVEGQNNCPIHTDQVLETDYYRKSYGDRQADFEAYYCPKCRKMIMRNAAAQKLDNTCSEIGIPQIEFRPLRPERKQLVNPSEALIRPDYFIQNGFIDVYDFDDNGILWAVLDEKDTVVINYSRSCIEEDHEAEDTLALIKVQEKAEGLKNYLVLIGYCEECEKYYIAQEDLALLIQKGRPRINLIDETGTYDAISSGSSFDAEKEHLHSLEETIDEKIETIKKNPSYVEKYATTYYEDGALAFAKKISEPLYKEINTLAEFKPNPYGYRADFSFDDKTEVYYLGIQDIELDGHRHVISFNSDLGRKMVNYRTLDMMIDGAKWKLRRRRTFDIYKENLYSFTEQSDEDVIFRSGITDTFLVKVLNSRKKHHQLIDIISTIQENQDAIVDVPLEQNLIVQGCAGSGKTMVLLHRLSSLKYKHPEFDFEQAVILTPNGNFNTHISGLASSLQVGYIDRFSIEDYYKELLRQYDMSFELRNPVSDEMNVRQEYVDFMYSSEFVPMMQDAYGRILAHIRNMIPAVQQLLTKMGIDHVDRNEFQDKDVAGYIRTACARLKNEIQQRQELFNTAVRKSQDLNRRKKYFEEQLPDFRRQLSEVVQAEAAKLTTELKYTADHLRGQISDLDTQIKEVNDEYTRVEGTVLVIRKAQRLNKLRNDINKLNHDKATIQNELSRIEAFSKTDFNQLGEEQKMDYLDTVCTLVANGGDSKIRIAAQQRRIANIESELKEIYLEIERTNEQGDSARNNLPAPELIERVEEISLELEPLTPKGIYQEIYKSAQQKADDVLFERTGRRYIKGVRGTHRYDLYLQLIFAMRFFGEKKGTHRLISVDEGQDLTPGEYALIKKINNDDVIFNIYGDINQLLKYNRGITDWALIDNTVSNAVKFTLNENYRNTNQITQFCNDSFKMQVSLTGVDGHSVKEISRTKLENTLSNLKVNEERIAVILPRAAKKDGYIDKEQLPDSIKPIINEKEIGNGQIAVVYVDEVKGVEFDTVFVVPNGMTKNEKYIAFTRALSDLTIVYDEDLDSVVAEELPAAETGSVNEKGSNQKSAADQAAGGIEVSANIYVGKMKGKKDQKAREKRNRILQSIHVLTGDIKKTPEIVEDNITRAIVAPCSRSMNGNGGLEYRIHRWAGKQIEEEIKDLSPCEQGEVRLTKGYDTPYDYIIHANGPAWNTEHIDECIEILTMTYRNILQCALDNKITELVIPSISTGNKQFPFERAAFIAADTIIRFISDHLELNQNVYFVLNSEKEAKLYERYIRNCSKGKDSKIAIGSCRNCGKKLAVRNKSYRRFILQDMLPRYCKECSKEAFKVETCRNCGAEFTITFGEKERCNHKHIPYPVLCNNCLEKQTSQSAQDKSDESGIDETIAKDVAGILPDEIKSAGILPHEIKSSDGEVSEVGALGEDASGSTDDLAISDTQTFEESLSLKESSSNDSDQLLELSESMSFEVPFVDTDSESNKTCFAKIHGQESIIKRIDSLIKDSLHSGRIMPSIILYGYDDMVRKNLADAVCNALHVQSRTVHVSENWNNIYEIFMNASDLHQGDCLIIDDIAALSAAEADIIRKMVSEHAFDVEVNVGGTQQTTNITVPEFFVIGLTRNIKEVTTAARDLASMVYGLSVPSLDELAAAISQYVDSIGLQIDQEAALSIAKTRSSTRTVENYIGYLRKRVTDFVRNVITQEDVLQTSDYFEAVRFLESLEHSNVKKSNSSYIMPVHSYKESGTNTDDNKSASNERITESKSAYDKTGTIREVILDAHDMIGHNTIYDAINATVGTQYRGWMKACWPNAFPDGAFRIWFPKLAECRDGQPVPSSFDCLNTISNDWNEVIFDDLKERQTEDGPQYYGYDLIFAKDPDGPYIFRGVYIRDKEKSRPNHGVSKRIGTKVRLTGKPGQPADKIEILDDFRKQNG